MHKCTPWSNTSRFAYISEVNLYSHQHPHFRILKFFNIFFFLSCRSNLFCTKLMYSSLNKNIYIKKNSSHGKRFAVIMWWLRKLKQNFIRFVSLLSSLRLSTFIYFSYDKVYFFFICRRIVNMQCMRQSFPLSPSTGISSTEKATFWVSSLENHLLYILQVGFRFVSYSFIGKWFRLFAKVKCTFNRPCSSFAMQ